MAFDNVLLPLTPKTLAPAERWSTTVFQVGGGAEVRNQWWSKSLKAWDATFADVVTLAQFQSLRNHHNARRGRTRSFPILDLTDYRASADAFGVGDGVIAAFQLKVARGDSGNAYSREVYKPFGTTQIFVNATLKTAGVHYNLNATTGVVTFTGGNIPTAGQALTWTGTYYIPARWDIDEGDFGALFMWVDGGTQLVQTEPVRFVETRDYV